MSAHPFQPARPVPEVLRQVSEADLAGVRQDWDWSEQFRTEVQEILGRYVAVPTPLHMDRNEAADLVVKPGHVAVRIRRARALNFSNQFTLRTARDSGSRAELEKVIDGYGDWLFYGFESAEEPGRLGIWHIVDLRAFRAHLIRGGVPCETKANKDGTHFSCWRLADFPPFPAILIASNHPELTSPKGDRAA